MLLCLVIVKIGCKSNVNILRSQINIQFSIAGAKCTIVLINYFSFTCFLLFFRK